LVYTGRHLAWTKRDGVCYEWALYVPNGPAPNRRDFLTYSGELCESANAGKPSRRVSIGNQDVVIETQADFDGWILDGMAELSDTGLRPEGITYESVLQLAASIRPTLPKEVATEAASQAIPQEVQTQATPVQQEYKAQMERIRGGADYFDQSTPLAALLSRNAAIIRNDRERLIALFYSPGDPERKQIRQETERLEKALNGMQGLRELVVDPANVVTTPAWPENPSEGATHTIDMYQSEKAPHPVFTMTLVFHESKWYVVRNRPGPGLPFPSGKNDLTAHPVEK
jgi:hypothetical protein